MDLSSVSAADRPDRQSENLEPGPAERRAAFFAFEKA